MNVQEHTTAPAAPARPIEWGDIDNALEQAAALVHQLHFLMSDLEEGFRFSRGKDVGTGGVSLSFQKDNIDATLWLTAEAWNRAKNLEEMLSAAMDRAEENAA